MCFSPKVKMPKADPAKIAAPTPAPLAEEVKGVVFGGSGSSTEDDDDKDTEGTSSEVKSKGSGKSSLKIKLDTKKPTSGGGSKKMTIKSRMSSGGKR